MKKIAVIYHSGHGHTAFLAQEIVHGAQSLSGISVSVLKAE